MTTILKASGLSALAFAMATTTALAQGALTGTTALNERIDEIERNVATDMARSQDAARFGNPDQRMGFSGSASLSYSALHGNTESHEFTLGARLRYAEGRWAHTLGLALDYGRNSTTGDAKQRAFGVFDSAYSFNPTTYGFVTGRLDIDGLATGTNVRTDGFIGAGPGFRIVNTPDTAWRVQAGIGASFIGMADGTETLELGYIASSRAFFRITENAFVTNDTDILYSNAGWRANNDLGLSLKVSNAVTTRVSYLTSFNSANAITTDGKLGVSLVFGF
jgi:putative salt-induced outer membrane protein